MAPLEKLHGLCSWKNSRSRLELTPKGHHILRSLSVPLPSFCPPLEIDTREGGVSIGLVHVVAVYLNYSWVQSTRIEGPGFGMRTGYWTGITKYQQTDIWVLCLANRVSSSLFTQAPDDLRWGCTNLPPPPPPHEPADRLKAGFSFWKESKSEYSMNHKTHHFLGPRALK
jgi:hypothetical protein